MSYQSGMLAAGLGGQLFEQRLEGHFRKATTAEVRGKSCVYFIEQAADFRALKIGFSGKKDGQARMGALQGGNPHVLRELFCLPGTMEHEELLHCVLTPHWLRGEWFNMDRLLIGFLETLQGRGLEAAIREYVRSIHQPEHATILRRVSKAAFGGPVHNMALANWGQTRKGSFENKQVAANLRGAALWQPRVIQ